ncbi:MAG: hypothetical protein N3J91_02755 [Verrucomicrobiae bacterium]|nr:hypothetical protein [Verrucomicrobiae bacterium]
MRLYTTTETFLANLPYAIMVLTGGALLAVGFGGGPWAWVGAAAYALYGLGGSLWTMIFICPYCAYYATRGCPCGYGMVAARLVPKAERECFAEKFRKHIPVLVPLWLIPAAVGGWLLWRQFDATLAVLLAVFVVDAFVLLPLFSRRHGCSKCPQRETCPWMGKA